MCRCFCNCIMCLSFRSLCQTGEKKKKNYKNNNNNKKNPSLMKTSDKKCASNLGARQNVFQIW